MSKEEIVSFAEILELIKQDFYLDAITALKNFIEMYPCSDVTAAALYDISLCYYETNQFEKSIPTLKEIIRDYPNIPITVLKIHNEFGAIAAKSYYLLVNCHLALGQIERARRLLSKIKSYRDSYTVKNGQKITYLSLAEKAITVYSKTKTIRKIHAYQKD